MTEPKRIQRKRARGWKMPENTIYVGRPTKWGNPFPLSDYGNFDNAREVCLEDFIACLQERQEYPWAQWIVDHIHELRGKDLACWCKEGDACHADVLLQLANSKQEEVTEWRK